MHINELICVKCPIILVIINNNMNSIDVKLNNKKAHAFLETYFMPYCLMKPFYQGIEGTVSKTHGRQCPQECLEGIPSVQPIFHFVFPMCHIPTLPKSTSTLCFQTPNGLKAELTAKASTLSSRSFDLQKESHRIF